MGAVREGDFIEYDEDIDVCIKYAELDNLKSLLFVLREKGLEVIRFTGELLSLERKGDYIDIYLFRHEKGKSWRCLGYEFPEKFFLTTEKINFLGYDFGCPKDKFEFLEICYGGDWKIPIVGKHARAVKNIWIRENIIPILPLWLKNTLKAVNRYLKGF